MDRKCSINGEKRNTYSILVGKPERPRSKWDESIKIDLREIRCFKY
jgi:hypothetical protein